MTTTDRDYYHERAQAELERAQEASHPAAVKAHYLLAEEYLERVYASPEAAAANDESDAGA